MDKSYENLGSSNEGVFAIMMALAQNSELFPKSGKILANKLSFDQWKMICDKAPRGSKMRIPAVENLGILAETPAQWADVFRRARECDHSRGMYQLQKQARRNVIDLVKTFDDCKLVYTKTRFKVFGLADKMSGLVKTLDECIYILCILDSRRILDGAREKSLKKLHKLANTVNKWLHVYNEAYTRGHWSLSDVAIEELSARVKTYAGWMRVKKGITVKDPYNPLLRLAKMKAYELARTNKQKTLVYQA